MSKYTDYLEERLQRKDKGNDKGYRGHTLVIQETFLNEPLNIKKFCEAVKKQKDGYVDFSNKLNNIPQTESYKEVCKVVSVRGNEVNNVLLKNIKPEALRMGLITADVNNNNNIFLGFKLSNLGKDFCDCDGDPAYLSTLCHKAAINLFNNNVKDDNKDNLSEWKKWSESEFPVFWDLYHFLDIYKFLDLSEMYIFLDKNTKAEKHFFIKEYRSDIKTEIRKNKLEGINEKTFEKYDKKNLSKIERRDFPNMTNQLRRVMEKLNLISFLFYDKKKGIITLKNDYGELKSFRYRSNTDIIDAKRINEITSIKNIDGHHIIPHENILTQNGEDRELIENWKNIIFLSEEDHRKFPNRHNLFINMELTEKYILFKHINDENSLISISLDNYIGKKELIKDMIDHNKIIIEYLKKQ